MAGVPLVPDWATDTVLLVAPASHMEVYEQDLPELQSFYTAFAAEIARHDAVICILPAEMPVPAHADAARVHWRRGHIGDIWVRDFAPLQATTGAAAFIYDPGYAPTRHSASVQQDLQRLLQTEPGFEGLGPIARIGLRLEGGNVAYNGAETAIVTDKVLSRNRNKSRREIERIMRDALALDRLVIVPCEPGDRFGHIDGMMRWLDQKRIVLNDYSASGRAGRAFADDLRRVLDRELGAIGRTVIPYPASDGVYCGWPDAAGNYVNFLRTRNRVYLPLYGLPEDAVVREIFEDMFAGRVSCVYPGALPKYGGVLNCIAWAFRAGRPLGEPRG
ncbi:MAG: agmatine deiminase family protein [Geminicoccaceae bacterium]